MRSRSGRFQIAGLVGFIVSGGFFLASALQNGDLMAILGCIAWILACLIWLIPLLTPAGDQDL